MKTAIYIEDGAMQLVLTPETTFEKNVVDTFRDKPLAAQLHDVVFYETRGGWTVYQTGYEERRSIILRIDERRA